MKDILKKIPGKWEDSQLTTQEIMISSYYMTPRARSRRMRSSTSLSQIIISLFFIIQRCLLHVQAQLNQVPHFPKH